MSLLVFFLLAFSPFRLFAFSQNPQDAPDLVIETHVVSIPLTIRDGKNRIALDLHDEDFRLYEDDREVPITYFGLDKTPVDVVLLMDTSRSVREELSALQEAAFNFVGRLNPNDRVSVWSFSDRADRVLDWTPSTERKTIAAALRSLEASGNTALYDSVRTVSNSFLTGQDESASSRPRRIAGSTSGHAEAPPNLRCIVLLTDGDDTNSRNTNLDQAVTESLRGEVSVYVISRSKVEAKVFEQILDSGNASASDRLLARAARDRLRASDKAMINLAERSGGRVLFPTQDTELSNSYGEIAEELHQRYSIGYTPPGDPHDKKFHPTRVECKRPNYRLWAREGYFAK